MFKFEFNILGLTREQVEKLYLELVKKVVESKGEVAGGFTEEKKDK